MRDFAGDLPGATAKVPYAVQEPFHKTLLTGKTHAAWRSRPSFYAVSTDDRTIDPDLERSMAKRMGAKTIEVKAGSNTDIEDRKRAEKKLLQDEGEPRRITDAIAQAIVVQDPGGRTEGTKSTMADWRSSN